MANNLPQAGASGDDIFYQELQACHGITAGDPFVAVSHGTSTAGLAGAATNNGKGIASYNWNVKVMPLQALGDDGSGWTSQIVAAIYYAVDNGAHIINLSLGGDTKDTSLEAAVNYAYSHGVTIIAAAGNCGTGGESGCNPASPGAMSYPALYDHVIAVGATDATDTRASFSSFGPGLDILAPGAGGIVAPLIYRGQTPADPNSFNYSSAYSASLYGTSFAAPMVSSLASLVKATRPAATPDEITAILDGTAAKPASMTSTYYTPAYGHGLIDAGSVITVARSFNSTAPTTPQLLQTGDNRSEHTFSSTATLSSGCKVPANTYCTVRVTDTHGHDRYLPFALASTAGSTGWQWPGSTLQSGEWFVRAVQGDKSSSTYHLFSK
ncbi:MAG: S8 family serine peptidase [Candidatus Saccharimonas sp.]